MAKIKLENLTYRQRQPDRSLMSFVEDRASRAFTDMKTKYHKDWESYKLLWETKFKETLRTRKSERSKLITPTTQIGVDTGTAQMDASLGYLSFIEVDPDVPLAAKSEWAEKYAPLWDEMVGNFRQDLSEFSNRSEVSDAIFNAGLYGLGILKVTQLTYQKRELTPEQDGEGVSVVMKDVTSTVLRSVSPFRFAFSPGATGVEDAQYVVERTSVPVNAIQDKIADGTYKAVKVNPDNDGMVTVIEYHGLVKKSDLMKLSATDSSVEDLVVADMNEDRMVEAIVVWEDGGKEPLYAEETPFLDGERSYRTFTWDKDPESPVGRGIAAKVFSVQKAQDANIRARTDAMAYAVHPMVGVDNLKLVSRRRMKVSPGAQILTQGDPSRAIVPFRFGDIPQSAFMQAQELASLAAQATGLDAFGGTDVKYQSGEGMDRLQQGTVARTRRVQESMVTFLKETIRLFLWRATASDPERYPPVSPDFKVTINVGSLTRANEMSQVSNMLKTIPESSPAYWRLFVKYFELSDMPDKEQIISEIKAMAKAVLNPPPPEPSFEERLLERKMALEEMREQANIQLQAARVRAELVRAAATIEKIEVEEMKAKADAILKVAQAESEEAGIQLAKYKAIVEGLANERVTGAEGGAAGGGIDDTNPIPRMDDV